MNDEFDRLWNDIADGYATQEDKQRFGQRLRVDSAFLSQFTLRLLDDATIVDELRQRQEIALQSRASIFSKLTGPRSLVARIGRFIAPLLWFVVMLVAGECCWHSRSEIGFCVEDASEEKAENLPAIPMCTKHDVAQSSDHWPVIA